MSSRLQKTQGRVAHTVTLMRRHGMPLSVAAQEAGTTPETVLRYGRPGQALKRVGGRWIARAKDKLARPMSLYGPKGTFSITVGSSEAASRIGKYHNAIRWYLETGDYSKLQKFRGTYVIDVHGKRHYFLTDPETIRGLARPGQFGFEGIY